MNGCMCSWMPSQCRGMLKCCAAHTQKDEERHGREKRHKWIGKVCVAHSTFNMTQIAVARLKCIWKVRCSSLFNRRGIFWLLFHCFRLCVADSHCPLSRLHRSLRSTSSSLARLYRCYRAILPVTTGTHNGKQRNCHANNTRAVFCCAQPSHPFGRSLYSTQLRKCILLICTLPCHT